MQIGIDSFAALLPDRRTGQIPSQPVRMAQLLEEVEAADRAGVDTFGVGEHHRAEFIDASPAVIMAAAAARTKTIRLNSAVTVLSAADPVRVFQDFATLDLVSGGRAEIVAGRGSFVEAFPLFGLALEDYDDLFVEKLSLLLQLRAETKVNFTGRFRAPLTGQAVYPRPMQAELPIWIGIGGTPQSAARAGALGLPMMIAIIGGTFDRFRPLVNLYKEYGRRAGHAPEKLKVGIHAMGYVADTDKEARDAFFHGWHYMFTTIGKERGFSNVTREYFDQLCEPGGAFIVGSVETVAKKVIETSETLGGLARVSFQMSAASGDHAAMLHSIDLLGRQVAPRVRARLPGLIA